MVSLMGSRIYMISEHLLPRCSLMTKDKAVSFQWRKHAELPQSSQQVEGDTGAAGTSTYATLRRTHCHGVFAKAAYLNSIKKKQTHPIGHFSK